MSKEGSAAKAAREVGQGWKENSFTVVRNGQTATLADVGGAGAIQHIWMRPTGDWRFSILRFYWDNQSDPSVEVPVGDFFAQVHFTVFRIRARNSSGWALSIATALWALQVPHSRSGTIYERSEGYDPGARVAERRTLSTSDR